jgi:squalene synthase HpnC
LLDKATSDNASVSIDHYENFPVASVLCPPHMRSAVTAIYHFARSADDIADEGNATADERRQVLLDLRRCTLGASRGAQCPPQWNELLQPLTFAIAKHDLPVHLLTDLLDAFIQDVDNPHYPDRSDLMRYCARSANPMGRLMLHLAGVHDETSLTQSDAVCSALQLINFWQDISVDLPRGRCYLPMGDVKALGLDPTRLQAGADTLQTQELVAQLCQWAGQLMREGAPLACRVPGRLGWELRLVVQGGLRILERIGAMQYRTFSRRPTLGKLDAWPLLWRALRMSTLQATPGFKLAHLPWKTKP